MKNICLLIVFIGVFATNVFGYQNSGLNIFTPSSLVSGEGELTLSHRFMGTVDDHPLDNFFGMDLGANVGIFARYNIEYGVEAKMGYLRDKSEYQMGASYKLTPDGFSLQAQLDLQYFSYNEPSQTDRRNNLLLVAAIQNSPLGGLIGADWINKFTITANAGYDNYYQRFVLGAGLRTGITEKISFIAEYAPVIDRSSADNNVQQYLMADDAFSLGLKADTYGHQFMFILSNHNAMDLRHFSMGTATGHDLMLGFNIQRKF